MLIEVSGALGLWMEFGTCPTGWHIEGDLPNQVAVSTDNCYRPVHLVWGGRGHRGAFAPQFQGSDVVWYCTMHQG